MDFRSIISRPPVLYNLNLLSITIVKISIAYGNSRLPLENGHVRSCFSMEPRGLLLTDFLQNFSDEVMRNPTCSMDPVLFQQDKKVSNMLHASGSSISAKNSSIVSSSMNFGLRKYVRSAIRACLMYASR